MGLFDTLLGRTKPVKANLDALFALPTAALTLQSAGGLVSSGHAGVCWKPPSGQGAQDLQAEVAQLVGDGFTQTQDSFGYGWLLLAEPELDDLVTKAHMANTTLTEAGWGQQLLCSVFGFVPEPGAASDARPFSLVYLYKRGTFYPFAPVDNQKERRDTELELRIRSMLGVDLPVEADLTRWFPLWDLPVTMTVERLIALEGAVNFRDLGGYATEDGQRTRWRVLFRADGLSELTGTDLAVMRQLGIRTVVDLRSGQEVEQSRFDVEAHPVTFHHFPFIKALPNAEDFERAPGFLGTQYTEMLDDATPQIVGALSALAAPDARPAVFHCTAGKDRTGLLSALVLSLLGVPEETVVADYALSGAAMARLRAKLIDKYPDGKSAHRRLRRLVLRRPGQHGGALRPPAGPLRDRGRLRGRSGRARRRGRPPAPGAAGAGRVAGRTEQPGRAARSGPAQLSAAGASGRWPPPGRGRAR